MKRNQKIILAFLIVVIIVLGLLLWQLVTTKKQDGTTTKNSSTNSPSTTTTSSTKVLTTDEILTDYIAKLPLNVRLGQVFLARVPAENQLTDLSTYHLGGYLLFGQDTEGQTLASLKEKIQSFQAASTLPLFIGSDEEGGTVSRLSYAGVVTPAFESPMALYQRGGLTAVTDDWQTKGKILTDLGIQLPLAPVADVATDSSAFIYDRTLGVDAATTAQYITAVVKAMKEAGVGSTLKHFPGYGNNGDSHTDIIHDTRSLEELESTDFVPFEAGIAAGADSILVAHNIVEAIDDTQPASISPAVHQVIREKLNFDGVVMTDDLDMAGLADFTSQEEAALKALQAGNDLILSSSYAKQIPYLQQAIAKGDYTEEQLNTSLLRIFKWKVQLGLLDPTNLPQIND